VDAASVCAVRRTAVFVEAFLTLPETKRIEQLTSGTTAGERPLFPPGRHEPKPKLCPDDPACGQRADPVGGLVGIVWG
jgi:hypothetical protein